MQLCEMLITEARRISNNQVLELMNIEITQDEPLQKLIIDKKMLINLLKEAMNKFMQDVMKAYVEEEVYIVSVEIEPKEYKCYWYVNTKENLNDKVQKTNGKNKWYYYFCENEWDIIENSPDYFDEFTKYIQRECKYKFDIIELYEVFVDAIVEFKKEKIFNEICRNDIIFALNAYERCSQKDIVEFFKKMNKDEDCKNYIDNIKEFF